MKQNNWKSIVAVTLVMVSLFAMSTFVNANIVEFILGDEFLENEELLNSSSDIPESAYTALNVITSGYDWMYEHHAYENNTYPYLPNDTTYTTYYISGKDSSERLVIGTDGSAYYTSDHYKHWSKM